MRRSVPWCIEDFHLHKQLYKGKASLLYSATCRLSNIPIALKLYRKEKLSTLNWYQVEREIRIHSQLAHNNIIVLYAAFEDGENVYLAQEYAAGGDLYEELKSSRGQIEEHRVAAEIVQPCLHALAYLHRLGIIHRDIKPENILLTAGRVIKLADFGLSINFNEERPVTRAGTLDYMAPEVLVCPEKSRPEENKEQALLEYTNAVDAWAVGILAYELLLGHPPFEKESRADTYEHIMYRSPPIPGNMPEGPRNFITKALIKAVQKRPSVGDLVTHAWLLSHQQQAPLPKVPAELALEVGSKGIAPAASMSISVDCTMGPAPSGTLSSAASNASSSGAADVSDTQQPVEVETSKHSVLQWAGSSLKTITKKLRKPATGVPTADSRKTASVDIDRASAQAGPRHTPEAHPAAKAGEQPPSKAATAPHGTSSSPSAQSFIKITSSSARQLVVRLPNAAEQTSLHISPTHECSPPSPFSLYAGLPEPKTPPRISATLEIEASISSSQTLQLPSMSRAEGLQNGGAPSPGRSRKWQRHQELRSTNIVHVPARPPIRSLASLTLGEREQAEEDAAAASGIEQRRRSLLVTDSGLKAAPPSPPAYLTRPWATQRLLRLETANLPPSSPSTPTQPSPLARRRRRIAGKVESSSSGSMALADTPKGGQFPSGSKSSRAFGGTSNSSLPTRPLAGRLATARPAGRLLAPGTMSRGAASAELAHVASATVKLAGVAGADSSIRRAASAHPSMMKRAGSQRSSQDEDKEGHAKGLSVNARRPSVRI